MNYKLSRAALWSACFILAACGGGGGGSDTTAGGGVTPPTPTVPPVVSTGDMFPSANNNRWVIRTDFPQASTFLRRVSSATSSDGAEVITINSDGGVNPYITETYKKTADGVWSINGSSSDALSRAIGTYQMLRLPLKTGETFNSINRSGVASTVDFDFDGKPETIDAKIDVTVEAKETLQTPFGSVEAWRVKTFGVVRFYLTGDGKTLPVSISMYDWYSPGIGVVKRKSEVAAGSQAPVVFNEDVQGYKTSSSSSNAAPPKLMNIQAEPLPSGSFELVYDRNISIDRDCEGEVVFHGPLLSQPARKRFISVAQDGYPGKTGLRDSVKVYAELKAPGVYRVELPDCIVDILGNKSEKASVEYVVGVSQAPLLVSSTLADRDSVFNNPFEFSLGFNKVLDATKTALNVSVSEADFFSVPTGFGAAVGGVVGGSVVTFRLEQPIRYFTGYGLRVSGVAVAVDGVSEKFDFLIYASSIEGPFSKFLEFRDCRNGIYADINGDGLLDSICSTIDSRGVSIKISKKDRSSSESQYIYPTVLGADPSDTVGRVVGVFDFNDDGRLDIVTERFTLLSSGDSYVLRNNPSVPFYEPLYWRSRTLGDYDGDGVPDLIESKIFVGLPEQAAGNSDSIIVYKGGKQTSGVFSSPGQVLGIEARSGRLGRGLVGVLQIKDFNRDGALDFYAAGVLYLSSASNQYREYLDHFVAGLVDLDGDGLDELIVAPQMGGDYFYRKLVSPQVWSDSVQIVNSCPKRRTSDGVETVAGDFNQDGMKDLMFKCDQSFRLALRASSKPLDYYFRDDVFRGKETLSPLLSDCVARDLDGDGYPDLVCDGRLHWNDFKESRFASLKSLRIPAVPEKISAASSPLRRVGLGLRRSGVLSRN